MFKTLLRQALAWAALLAAFTIPGSTTPGVPRAIQSGDEPIVKTTEVEPPRPVRRLLGRIPDPIQDAAYLVPLSAETVLTLANLDPNPVTAKVYSDVNTLFPVTVSLEPGEQKNVSPPAGLAAFLSLDGASDDANIHVIATHRWSVNGKPLEEIVAAVPKNKFFDTGQWGYMPGSLRPGHPGEEGKISGSLLACASDQTGPIELVLFNGTGNIVYNKNGEPAVLEPRLKRFSCVAYPDLFTAFNVDPDQDVLRYQVTSVPFTTGMVVYISLTENNSGDRDTIKALSQNQMETMFTLPIVRRLTTSVPFAQYTDLHAINPSQTPYTRMLNFNFTERSSPGQPLTGTGREIHALTHHFWKDIVSNIFVGLPQGSERLGATTGSTRENELVLAWSKIRTVMPYGDVGAWVPGLNQRDVCGKTATCSLIGLENGYTLGLVNRSPYQNTVRIDVHDATGLLLGSEELVLGKYENKERLLTGYEGVARVRLTGSHDDRGFHAWATNTTPDGDENYQAAKKIPGDAAVNYVNKWLRDNTEWPLNEFWLSDKETCCMWLENCGVTGYRHLLASYLVGTDSVPPDWTANDIEGFILNFFDGNPINGEIDHTWDNQIFQNRSDRRKQGIAFGMASGGATPFYISIPQRMHEIRENIYRSFLRDLVRARPEDYGGSVGGLPDMNHDPTWDRQDRSP